MMMQAGTLYKLDNFFVVVNTWPTRWLSFVPYRPMTDNDLIIQYALLLQTFHLDTWHGRVQVLLENGIIALADPHSLKDFGVAVK